MIFYITLQIRMDWSYISEIHFFATLVALASWWASDPEQEVFEKRNMLRSFWCLPNLLSFLCNRHWIAVQLCVNKLNANCIGCHIMLTWCKQANHNGFKIGASNFPFSTPRNHHHHHHNHNHRHTSKFRWLKNLLEFFSFYHRQHVVSIYPVRIFCQSSF